MTNSLHAVVAPDGDAAPFEADERDFESCARPGYAKIAWSISASGEADGRSVLSVTARATDIDSACRFWDAWTILGPLVESQTRRLAASVNALAQELEDRFEASVEAVRPRLQLVR